MSWLIENRETKVCHSPAPPHHEYSFQVRTIVGCSSPKDNLIERSMRDHSLHAFTPRQLFRKQHRKGDPQTVGNGKSFEGRQVAGQFWEGGEGCVFF